MISLILLCGVCMQFYLKLYRSHEEVINYLIVGVLTTIVSIVSYNLFRFIIESYMVCTVISWVLAVLFAYVTNRRYVFHSKDKNIGKEISKFVSSRILTLLIEMFIMFVCVDLLHINDRIAKLLVQVVVTILNYVFSKLFVFHGKKEE